MQIEIYSETTRRNIREDGEGFLFIPHNKLGQPRVSHNISLNQCVTATLTVKGLILWFSLLLKN